MRNLGAAMAGGLGKRQKDDFYPTPPEVIQALLASEWGPSNSAPVWEPACGDGALSKYMERQGYSVVSTDLVDRGYGTAPVDYLTAPSEGKPRQVVTNPPFKIAAKFVLQGITNGAFYQAHLLKSQYWHAATRLPLFNEHPPCAVLPLTWRPDFTGGGSPTMDCAWMVWTKERRHRYTAYEPLPKPSMEALAHING